ncbi:MAG: OmpH family outer membrane protein [Holosporales bacterium]|jgi:Skp family chaperone for outer membrane proteins|nr:OmpH family outer membrane protein [Holosporales bacterium]
MSKWQIALLSCVVGLVPGLLIRPRFANVTAIPSLKVAVVNGARLKQDAEPFLFAQKDAERIEQEIGAWLDKKRENLQRLAQLVSNNAIPPKKRAEYKSQYEQEYANIDAELRTQKEALQRKIYKLNVILNEAVMEVTQQLAKKYGLNMVLNTQVGEIMTVYCADKSADLTDEAIDWLNKKLRNIEELVSK